MTFHQKPKQQHSNFLHFNRKEINYSMQESITISPILVTLFPIIRSTFVVVHWCAIDFCSSRLASRASVEYGWQSRFRLQFSPFSVDTLPGQESLHAESVGLALIICASSFVPFPCFICPIGNNAQALCLCTTSAQQPKSQHYSVRFYRPSFGTVCLQK